MAILNKITRVYPVDGAPVSDEQIQTHIDEMNAAGWSIVTVTDLNGWYRVFWQKVEE